MSVFSTVPSRRFLFCFVHNNLTVSQIFSFVRKILPGTSGPKWKIYLCLSIPHYVLYAVHLHEYQRGSRGVFGPLRNRMTHLLFLRKWNYWDKCLMCFHLLYSSRYSKYALAKKSLKQKGEAPYKASDCKDDYSSLPRRSFIMDERYIRLTP